MNNMSQNLSLEESIDSIYEYLYLNSLDRGMITSLTLFMEAYNQTLNEYLNADVPSEAVTERLRLLSGPVDFVLKNFPDTGDEKVPYPAVEIIKKRLNERGAEMEKGFTRVLTPNTPNIIPDQADKIQINGFSYAIIVVILTILLGTIIGALLFFIK